MSTTPSLNRRGFLRAAAIAVAAGTVGTVGTVGAALPQARAQGAILGTVIDYSAGVPSAAAVKAAGHLGAVRYVSGRRPGAEWMLGKPVTAAETQDFANHGLAVASVYQYGKDATADWKQGALGAATHAPQAISYHRAAGGPTGRPIYVAIDDNPTRAQYDTQIRPYLQAFQAALQLAGYQTGVYGNYSVIDWAVQDGIGQYFWMHNWGSNGQIHPRTTLHQIRIDKDKIEGIGIDINNVYAQDWGQWTPGQAQPQSAIPASATNAIPSLPNSSSLSQEQIQQGVDLVRKLTNL